MTELQWIAALLSPRSVAPHPNFRSADEVTPAGRLALIVQGRGYEQDNAVSDPNGEDVGRLLEAAENCFNADLGPECTTALIAYARKRGVDTGQATAAALLASVALSDADRQGDAVELLRGQISRRRSDGSESDRIFLRGLMYQQLAMRTMEMGEPDRRARQRAQDLLAIVDAREMSRYPVSKGSRWTALATNRQMLIATQSANSSLFDHDIFFPGTSLLKQWLRRPISDLTASVELSESAAHDALINEQYAYFALSNERSIRNEDPVDAPHWRANLYFELIGHYQRARHSRRQLGQLRLMRSAPDSTGGARDGLRLLRHAGDLKAYKLALDFVRGHGPLAILHTETEHVIRHRLSPKLLRNVEIATLESGAQTLSQESAGSALDGLFRALIEGPNPNLPQRELPVIRAEQLFQAAAAIAPVADRVPELAERVLDSAIAAGPTDDQLLTRAHARAVSPVDWKGLSPQLVARWREWISDQEATRGWEDLTVNIGPLLRAPEASTPEPSSDVTLQRVVGELNALIAGATAPAWLSDRATELIEPLLVRDRLAAERGMHSFSGFNAADVAVGLIQFADAQSLWDPLTDFLTDRNVMRDHKTAALNRLGESRDQIPETVREKFIDSSDSLLLHSGVTSPFSADDITPYPAALRALAAMDAIDQGRLLSGVLQLAAGDERSRLEAARTLTSLVRRAGVLDQWMSASILQLSNDTSANVRAETGRALALAITRAQFARPLMSERLLDLLREDGILVPLLVLRGMTEDRSLPVDSIEAEVHRLSQRHIAHGVRLQATILIQTATPGVS